jgi:hypothetical protein
MQGLLHTAKTSTVKIRARLFGNSMFSEPNMCTGQIIGLTRDHCKEYLPEARMYAWRRQQLERHWHQGRRQEAKHP